MFSIYNYLVADKLLAALRFIRYYNYLCLVFIIIYNYL